MDVSYCDSHTHLLDPAFDGDRDQVISSCFVSGIKYIAEIACEPKDWQNAVSLKKQYPENIFVALGVHPHDCDKLNAANLQNLRMLCSENAISAVGEIGLDYAKSGHKREKQIEVFETMLSEADLLQKPVILHCRNSFDNQENAYADLFDVLKQKFKKPKGYKFSGILHCFSGTYEDAERAVDMGFLLGVNGTLTYPKNNDLRETVKKIGLKNIITETDCPYLPPQTSRGKRNSPLKIPEISKTLSKIFIKNETDILKATVENFYSVFCLPKLSDR